MLKYACFAFFFSSSFRTASSSNIREKSSLPVFLLVSLTRTVLLRVLSLLRPFCFRKLTSSSYQRLVSNQVALFSRFRIMVIKVYISGVTSSKEVCYIIYLVGCSFYDLICCITFFLPFLPNLSTGSQAAAACLVYSRCFAGQIRDL